MARTLARSLAWIAVLAVLMAGGFFFKFLKAEITPPISSALEWAIPKGSEAAFWIGNGVIVLSFAWLAWLAYRWWKD